METPHKVKRTHVFIYKRCACARVPEAMQQKTKADADAAATEHALATGTCHMLMPHINVRIGVQHFQFSTHTLIST